MCKQRDYFACFFKGKTRTADPTHVIRNLSGSPPIISVWWLPCNTGNPNPNDQVHITKLHTNYRHEMLITLLLVAGVIFAPQLSYFNSMSVCFTVWLIAGLSLLPCVPTLNYNHWLPRFPTSSFFFSSFKVEILSSPTLPMYVSVVGCNFCNAKLVPARPWQGICVIKILGSVSLFFFIHK